MTDKSTIIERKWALNSLRVQKQGKTLLSKLTQFLYPVNNKPFIA